VLGQTLVLHRGRVLLNTWKAGELVGRKTGLLGAVLRGEDPTEAAVRIAMECGNVQLEKSKLNLRAIFRFKNTEILDGDNDGYDEEFDEYEFLYEADHEESISATETDLAIPEWVDVESIPYESMPADDLEWYPTVLQGKSMRGSFTFRGKDMIEKEIWEVEEIILDVFQDVKDGDLSRLNMGELKHLAEGIGLKKPGSGWPKVAPPLARKIDLIRALRDQDKEYQKWRDLWMYDV